MELIFRLRPDDLIAFEQAWKREKQNVRAYRNYGIYYGVLIGVIVWCPFIFVVLSHTLKNPNFQSNYATNGIGAYWIFFPFVLPVVLFYGLWFAAPLLRKKIIESSTIIQNEVRLRFDRNGVQGTEHLMLWENVQNVIFTQNHLFLVDKTSKFMVVPLRIFNSEFEVQDFVATIKGYWESGKSNR